MQTLQINSQQKSKGGSSMQVKLDRTALRLRRRGALLPMLVVLWWVSSIRLLLVRGESDAPVKRLGRKKKIVEGKVFCSYGLSPIRMAAESPQKRVVEYSREAVQVASSSSASAASMHHNDDPSEQGAAPGCQAKVDLRPYMSAVEDQSASNSCAANAVAGAYEYLATRAALREEEAQESVGDISRLFIYYVGRKRDQVLWGEDHHKRPRDEGMTLQGAIEAIQLKGAALQASWPFDLSRVNHRPPADAFDQAMRYKVGDAMSIPLDLDKIRQVLSDGYPIVFGLKLTRAFFKPPPDGFIPTPDPSDPKSAEHGLHAMLIVGYNDRQRVFIVRNSWGTGWGVDGYGYLSYDYVCNEQFNFVGMYAIQSLTDDDLTPDNDDFEDLPASDESSDTTLDDIEFEDAEDDESDDEDEDDDWDDMFDSRAEALRAFVRLAGDHGDMASHNLLLDKQELNASLKLMGVPMVSEAELDMVMRMYDDDKSGMIDFDEFLDMQEFFNGSLLKRRSLFSDLGSEVSKWTQEFMNEWLDSDEGDEAHAWSLKIKKRWLETDAGDEAKAWALQIGEQLLESEVVDDIVDDIVDEAAAWAKKIKNRWFGAEDSAQPDDPEL